MKKLLYLAIPAILAAGCDNQNTATKPPEPTAPSFSPQMVSSGFTHNDKPATSFYFGTSKNDIFDVTIYKENVKPGYSAETYKDNNPELTADANFGGSYYDLSSKHETNFSFSISETADESGSLEITASGILFSPHTKKMLELPPTKIIFPAEMVREGLLEK